MAQQDRYINNIFEVLNEAVFVYDQDMTIRYFNKRAEEITQFKRDDVLGKKCITLFRDSICQNNCALCMTAKTGDTAETIQFSSPFTRKDGVTRDGEFHVGLINKGPKNQREVLVAMTDATEVNQLREDLKESHSFRSIIGKSPMMVELFKAIKNIAAYDSTVLLQGESGTGKELVANAIHFESPRAANRIIKVNCSAFSENLLESELFGHVKGAFTGALRDRVGRFEEGDGGTIFLDEIGDMSPQVQVSLLRVLQEREVERVGDNRTRKVDIRIIAATNKDLMEEVRNGRFREDLFYRLNVIPIQLPPLRTRKEDIPYLVQHFISHWKGSSQKSVKGVTSAALRRLMEHDWPGNVRELENAVERACVVSEAKRLGPEDFHLPAAAEKYPRQATARPKLTGELIRQTLEKHRNNQTRAAQELGLHRVTLWRKMKSMDLC